MPRTIELHILKSYICLYIDYLNKGEFCLFFLNNNNYNKALDWGDGSVGKV